ncbi:PspA/IM30 family protein [Haliscomenobacter sp.]|uniref:PspA/IM30 family protein n=1 Tax=Haliscomenobacter sp. TaxID=2717303 RepID=UPI00359432CF
MALENPEFKTKSFWSRPEGTTGALFGLAILAGVGYLIASNITFLIGLAANTLTLALMIVALVAILYMVLDPKMRTLVWYMYKSVMRWVTGMFVTIDPIGILKNYIEDLEDNLGKMRKQIGVLRGQMRQMTTLIEDNNKEIDSNMRLAAVARDQDKDQQMLLASRKAARLRESNEKYAALHQKMEILYRILSKMHSNSEVLLEDTKDQVKVKEIERKAIRTSHSAMRSAMSVISGDPDKRAMFDAAMDAITEDVANKVGEMENFMDMSSKLMDSIDLQNGMFEEQGMAMLEDWEKKSTLMLMEGTGKSSSAESLDLDSFKTRPEKEAKGDGNDYSNLFNN